MEAFSEMRTPAFVFDLHQIQSQILSLAKDGDDVTEADRQTHTYYTKGNGLVWVSRMGVDHRADSLLAWLHRVNEIGMSERAFGVADIESDLQRMRALDFDEGKNSINRVAARLEYSLTKACLRYAIGQRYGFVNPHRVFNNLDIDKEDTVKNIVTYRGLFDVDMELPSNHYVHTVLHKVRTDSIAQYLHKIQPYGNYYERMKAMLATASTHEQRRRVMVNMERGRWRRHQPIVETDKHIVVNIPAYHLYAYGADTTLDMRVVCGTLRTKTPQLSSYIEWMEVNPQWIIPMSIIESDVALRAGDSAYFARNRYQIYNRSTNRPMGVHEVTREMLLSGKYRVAQAGGAGNSLGRIVFRFKNKFAVFLHDTSNPRAFSRESRAVSHGCVRVSRPFDLASFVLDHPDEWLLDCIRISMGLNPETEQGIDYMEQNKNGDHRLVSYVPVTPRVPIYIIYNTLWPDADGVMQPWSDVYGYDEVMWKQLQPYM